MKTGIVLSIQNGNAIIMKKNGQFITLPAEINWQKGDIVLLHKHTYHINNHPIYKIAACFILILIFGAIGTSFYFNPVTLISIDVNPSIEVNLNRFDCVVSIKALNEEGREILSQTNVIHKPYKKALELLFSSQNWKSYINNKGEITFTVLSNTKEKENQLLQNIENCTNEILLSCHENAEIESYGVDQTLVKEAHSYGISAGTYLYILKLKEIHPEIDISSYSHHSIPDIKETIKECKKQETEDPHEENHHNTEHE